VSGLPPVARKVLSRGTLCHLAAPSPAGPHVTPVVFVLHGDRVWGTTGRGTTKARRWRRDPVAGGLIQWGPRAVTFRGAVTTYDVLEPSTWRAVARNAPRLSLASTRFSLKNARFFAGYARDVGRLPLAWTPPARVAFSVELEAGAVLEDGAVVERWGSWSRSVGARPSFRAVQGNVVESDVPNQIRELLGRSGEGALGVPGSRGPVVLPVRWTRWRRSYLAVLPRRVLALAGVPPLGPASLVIDRASSWRATDMRGVLLRGEGAVFVPAKTRAGRDALLRAAAVSGDVPSDPAVVRIAPRSAIWWEGWSSGTVGRR
jgi:hypothetical protein